MVEDRPEQEAPRRARRTADEVVIRLPAPGRLLRALLPEEAVGHLYAAQREQLLALRSLIDAAIERLEAAPRDTERQPPPRAEIKLD